MFIECRADTNTKDEMIQEIKNKFPIIRSSHQCSIRTCDDKEIILFSCEPLTKEEIEELEQLTSDEFKMLMSFKGLNS